MAKGGYAGVGSKAHKLKKLYLGVAGKARKLKKMYVGIGGKARLWWQSGGNHFKKLYSDTQKPDNVYNIYNRDFDTLAFGNPVSWPSKYSKYLRGGFASSKESIFVVAFSSESNSICYLSNVDLVTGTVLNELNVATVFGSYNYILSIGTNFEGEVFITEYSKYSSRNHYKINPNTGAKLTTHSTTQYSNISSSGSKCLIDHYSYRDDGDNFHAAREINSDTFTYVRTMYDGTISGINSAYSNADNVNVLFITTQWYRRIQKKAYSNLAVLASEEKNAAYSGESPWLAAGSF